MLADATAKARKLVTDLERQRGELEVDAGSTSFPPEQLEQGKRAFDEAIVSARHVLDTLHATSSRPGLRESGSH